MKKFSGNLILKDKSRHIVSSDCFPRSCSPRPGQGSSLSRRTPPPRHHNAYTIACPEFAAPSMLPRPPLSLLPPPPTLSLARSLHSPRSPRGTNNLTRAERGRTRTAAAGRNIARGCRLASPTHHERRARAHTYTLTYTTSTRPMNRRVCVRAHTHTHDPSHATSVCVCAAHTHDPPHATQHDQRSHLQRSWIDPQDRKRHAIKR